MAAISSAAMIAAAGSLHAKPTTPAPPSWCSFAHEHRFCITGKNCTYSTTCRWPTHTEATAVIFSDRLVQTGMVTMTSLCRHPSELTVFVLTQIGADYREIPHQYLSCRVITMHLHDAIEHLRAAGWRPDSICDPPGSSHLGERKESTLFGALPWDKDSKHAACANHLRFYLPEFPALRHKDRILFIDDDVVVMRDPVKGLLHQQLPEGVLLTANCDVNIWNDRCQRFDVGRPTYAHFVSSVRAQHLPAPLRARRAAGRERVDRGGLRPRRRARRLRAPLRADPLHAPRADRTVRLHPARPPL